MTSWIEDQNLIWRILDDRHAGQLQPVLSQTTQNIVQVSSTSDFINASLYLHLLVSPRTTSDVVSPSCTRNMTDTVQRINRQNQHQQQKIQLIHLHEDVWHSKHAIVTSRLLMRLGHCHRIFARKTVAKRINAATALPFLHDHHLWDGIKSKYYYGLFLKTTTTVVADDNNSTRQLIEAQQEEELVAVASFSSRRKIVRNHRTHRSHELIRYCAQCDGAVVGGITKLVKAFIRDHNPDDIVTVVDRDWGPGDGWHSLGFETVHVMPPLVMVMGKNDGVRRHLVGAGIRPTTTMNNDDNSTSGRSGVDKETLEELDRVTTSEDALMILIQRGYYPVYDTGVERLLMIVSKKSSIEASTLAFSALDLWKTSVPSYSSTYYSSNQGISALLLAASTANTDICSTPKKPTTHPKKKEFTTFVDDSRNAIASMAEWRSTGGTAKTAKVLYSIPSSLDPNATVEVRERPGGWSTLGIVGGSTKSIYHGIYKTTGGGGNMILPLVLVSEHLRSMVSMFLAARECCRQAAAGDLDEMKDFSCLYFGYGAGCIPRWMSRTLPGSRHVAVELDEGVVQVAMRCHPLKEFSIELQMGDALTYNREHRKQQPFDALFVDIFDGHNLLPKDFYDKSFLEHIRDDLLVQPHGIVIHNFHTGSKNLRIQLDEAILSYRSVFNTTLTLDSLDSRQNAGNTILLATSSDKLVSCLSSEGENGIWKKTWHTAALQGRHRWGIDFDVAVRATHNLQSF